MSCSKIVIVRHAEKDERDQNLSPRGESRAFALGNALVLQYGTADFVFASSNTKNSDRPLETITPYAKRIGKKVKTKFVDADFKKLATMLLKPKYANKTVVVCWHHGKIPDLIKAIGAKSPYEKWPEEVFDRIIEIDFVGDLAVSNKPQKLVHGDADV
jgi:phosphohistidine phosphatase SixA